MTLDEIIEAVDAGLPVRWANSGYHVTRDSIGQLIIECVQNQHIIGLTWADGVTLNGKPEDFYIDTFPRRTETA